RRRDRRPHHRPHPAGDPRSDRGAAMIRPTRRAVLLFALGVPFAFLLVILDRVLWEFSLDLGALVLVALGVDMLLALPRRRLRVDIQLPDALHIGDAGAIELDLAARH